MNKRKGKKRRMWIKRSKMRITCKGKRRRRKGKCDDMKSKGAQEAEVKIRK